MLLRVGCIVCRLRTNQWVAAQVHHILRGGHAMGELYTIPLCPGHHQGYWDSRAHKVAAGGVALSDGRPLFNRTYQTTEQRLWSTTNRMIGVEAMWPAEKVPSKRGD